MGTIVGVAGAGGAVVGADRLTTDEGTVTGESLRRLVDFEDAGWAAAGDPGDVGAFHRQVEREVRDHRTRTGQPPGVDRLARVAAGVAETTGVDAVVVARDSDGRAALRTVSADGAVLADRTAAFGTGAAVARGHLEGVPEDADLDAAASAVRTALSRAAERDPQTGTDVDVWRLADADSDPS